MTDSIPVSGGSRRSSREVAPRAVLAHAVGAYGEQLAARYLVESGMQILERNWRCDQGEIDIVSPSSENVRGITSRSSSTSGAKTATR